MAVFFEGRQTQTSEDNIELGDGGWHDLSGVVLHGMAVFFEEPGTSAIMEICGNNMEVYGFVNKNYNVVKTIKSIINHPPVITLFIGGIRLPIVLTTLQELDNNWNIAI